MTPVTERFEVRRRLGSGAFGEVYLAYDRVRAMDVALKRLSRRRESDVWRFKQEFRALADVQHRNLVALYELLQLDDSWYLTMEWVEGEAPRDVEAWRSALPGMVEGLRVLHASGHLHRDIKLSHILVQDGRAVWLDFGLVGTIGERLKLAGNLSGIAPEQVREGELGPACDYYALGAMLFEAFVGAPPFQGRGAQVLAQKVQRDAPSVAECAPEFARSHPRLATLVDALLRRDPEERMEAAVSAGAALDLQFMPDTYDVRFVGRQRELERLVQEAKQVGRGAGRHARVVGQSAMGKSALVSHFAAHQLDPGTTVLWGRCYELDGSDHRGMDGIVRQLLARSTTELSSVSLAALRQLFPGAAPEPASASEWSPTHGTEHSAEVARLARQAVEELLDGIPGPCVVLILDDAQWGDAPTGRLLGRLTCSRLLLITVQRTDEPPGSLLRELDSQRPPDLQLVVESLSDEAVRELAQDLDVAQQDAIVQRAGGHPFVAQELLLRGTHDSTEVALQSLLTEKLEQLPEAATQMMNVITTSTRPLERAVVFSACEKLGKRVRFEGLVALRRSKLVRSRYTARGLTLEPLHAAIARANEILIQRGGREPTLHAALDDALEELDIDDFEARAYHAEHAERAARAVGFYCRAGEQAANALRFDRSAGFYGRAIALLDDNDNERRTTLLELRARAAGAAGDHLGAAQDFRDALGNTALSLSEPRTIDLARGQAEHLLHAGKMERGYAALGVCLQAAALPAPTSRWLALPSILSRRRRVTHPSVPTPRGGIDPREQVRIDLAFSAGLALSNVDSLLGVDYVLRSIDLAARSGDRRGYARGVALAAGYMSSAGQKVAPMVDRVLDFADREAAELDDSYIAAMALGSRTVHRFHQGRHAESLDLAYETETAFRKRGGLSRECVTAQIYQCVNLAALARWGALRVARERLAEEGMTRNDRFAYSGSCVAHGYMVWLVDDVPERARRELDRAMQDWGNVVFQVQHFFALLARCRVDLYQARPADAVRRLKTARPALVGSLLFRLAFVRVHLAELEARAYLAQAFQERGLSRELKLERARFLAKALRRERSQSFDPLADVVDAGVAEARHDRSRACTLLQRATMGFLDHEKLDRAEAAAAALRALGGPTIHVETEPVADREALRRSVGWVPPRP